MPRIHPVIMCGGSGTRLWPVSRRHKPKQFQAFTSDHTLFQETLLRVSGDTTNCDFAPPVIIGSAAYLSLIEAQLRSIDITSFTLMLEPCPRNTAAVAAIAALHVKTFSEPDDLILLMPSDHHIDDHVRFHEAIQLASKAATEGWLTTFGITPDGPETGYGYIQSGEALYDGCSKVRAFHEKPILELAKTYLEQGGYTWNAGIFLFSPTRMLAEFEKFQPEILSVCDTALDKAQCTDHIIHIDQDTFSQCPSISIDYAVMERTEHAAICGPVDCGWSDIGSWGALSDMSSGMPTNNVVSIDSNNCYVHCDEDTTVATIGVEDLIIVVHEGAVLVAHADKSQDIGAIVTELKNRGQDDKL